VSAVARALSEAAFMRQVGVGASFKLITATFLKRPKSLLH
jgi:hypothetical protein